MSEYVIIQKDTLTSLCDIIREEMGTTKLYSLNDILNIIPVDFIHIITGSGLRTVIPDGITSIKDFAFYNCTHLTSVVIPNGVTSIGGCAFADCVNISSIEIPSSVKSIGNQAFRRCKLDNVYITDLISWLEIESNTSILNNSNLFVNGQLLSDLVIPDGISNIRADCFSYCDSLTSVIIPDSVKTIDYHAFSSCKNINTVTFKGRPDVIDNYVFLFCGRLTTINVPWSEGEVAGAPWGATNATINYNVGGEL